MNKKEVIAHIIMEQTTEPMKVQNLKMIGNKDGLWFLRFHAFLQDWNRKNRNGRIYMDQAMIPALRDPAIMELIRQKSWCGEYGHPITKDTMRILTIDPNNICHKITSLEVDKKGASGWIETLVNDKGTNYAKLILQGMEPAFSLRALAAINRDTGTEIIQSRAKVVTYDAVILPSHKIAYRDTSKQISLNVVGDVDPKRVVQEGSVKPYNHSTTDYVEPLYESSMKNFLMEESFNVKTITDKYEVCQENVHITKDLKHVIMQENDRSFIINIEEKIQKDIAGYTKSLF